MLSSYVLSELNLLWYPPPPQFSLCDTIQLIIVALFRTNNVCFCGTKALLLLEPRHCPFQNQVFRTSTLRFSDQKRPRRHPGGQGERGEGECHHLRSLHTKVAYHLRGISPQYPRAVFWRSCRELGITRASEPLCRALDPEFTKVITLFNQTVCFVFKSRSLFPLLCFLSIVSVAFFPLLYFLSSIFLDLCYFLCFLSFASLAFCLCFLSY